MMPNRLHQLLETLLLPETIQSMKQAHPEFFNVDYSSMPEQLRIQAGDSIGLNPSDAVCCIQIARGIYREREYRTPPNLEAAIRLLSEAETIFPPSDQDVKAYASGPGSAAAYWAAIQFHRGEVLWYRAFIDPEKTSAIIEQALASYHRALAVYSFDTWPDEWAHTLQSIAMNFVDRIEGTRGDNLARAITCMEESLRVYTRESHPQEWANTMINLGSIHAQLPGGRHRRESGKRNLLSQTGSYYSHTGDKSCHMGHAPAEPWYCLPAPHPGKSRREH